MDELSWNDACQLYHRSVIEYDGVLVYILDISKDFNCTAINLKDGKKFNFLVERKKMKSVSSRLGYINVHGGAVFVERQPVRKFVVGISLENLSFTTTLNLRYPIGEYETRINSRLLYKGYFYDVLMNKYPSLEKAYSLAVEKSGSFAFDRQFAVSHNRNVVYRNILVGMYNTDTKRIDFNDRYSHLELVLSGIYHEKHPRDFQFT